MKNRNNIRYLCNYKNTKNVCKPPRGIFFETLRFFLEFRVIMKKLNYNRFGGEKMNEHNKTYNQHAHEHIHDGHSLNTHSHTHTHTNTKAVLNRLSRAIGHLTSVRGMVERGQDCSEVLIQLAAVRSAINGVCKVILKDHLDHCIVDAVKTGDTQAIEELNRAIELLMK